MVFSGLMHSGGFKGNGVNSSTRLGENRKLGLLSSLHVEKAPVTCKPFSVLHPFPARLLTYFLKWLIGMAAATFEGQHDAFLEAATS